MTPSPNLPYEQEIERRKKISDQVRKRHRLNKLDTHLHEDAINNELKEKMVAYGYVNLSKAIVRHGLEHEGIDYLEGEDGQFWLGIVRKAIQGGKE